MIRKTWYFECAGCGKDWTLTRAELRDVGEAPTYWCPHCEEEYCETCWPGHQEDEEKLEVKRMGIKASLEATHDPH